MKNMTWMDSQKDIVLSKDMTWSAQILLIAWLIKLKNTLAYCSLNFSNTESVDIIVKTNNMSLV